MDVYGRGKEKMTYTLNEVREFLKANLIRDCQNLYGINDKKWFNKVTDNWFNDQYNYDGRWKVIIRAKVTTFGKILDMAAGCGTFVLYGLNHGYDVWGIEPEAWKREYYRRKIEASNYPGRYIYHIGAAVGEQLPYADDTFDFITTYQTLEHVNDVNKCIEEMLRVLKVGGILYIKAPNYNGFYEPHYRIPFLPRMSKRLASIYLKMIGRPLAGLRHLKWITEKSVMHGIIISKHRVIIQKQSDYYKTIRKTKIITALPSILRKKYVIDLLDTMIDIRIKTLKLLKFGCEEDTIDLLVTKIS